MGHKDLQLELSVMERGIDKRRRSRQTSKWNAARTVSRSRAAHSAPPLTTALADTALMDPKRIVCRREVTAN